VENENEKWREQGEKMETNIGSWSKTGGIPNGYLTP